MAIRRIRVHRDTDAVYHGKLATFPVILYNPRRWNATVAQLVEQTIRNRQVMGSNPIGGSPEIIQKHWCGMGNVLPAPMFLDFYLAIRQFSDLQG